MDGRERPASGILLYMGDRRTRGRQATPQPNLLVYCVVSAILATGAATVTSLTASGVARIAVWSSVLGLVSVLAGLAYDSVPVNALWSACRLARRHRAGA
jgi:hypothetical protein